MALFRRRLFAFVVLTTTVVILSDGCCGALQDGTITPRSAEDRKRTRSFAFRISEDYPPGSSPNIGLRFLPKDAAKMATSGGDGATSTDISIAGKRRALRFSEDADNDNARYDQRKPRLSVTRGVDGTPLPEDEGAKRQAREEAKAGGPARDGGGGYTGGQAPPSRLDTPFILNPPPFTEGKGAATAFVKPPVTAPAGSVAPPESTEPDPTPLCTNLDLTIFDKGRTCGAPLGAPCFDQSLCRQENGGDGSPKIYVYDNECTLAASSQLRSIRHVDDRIHHQYHDHQHEYWREAAWKLGLLAETYEEACLFIHVETSAAPVPCATTAPLWNEGANHLIMQFSDLGRNMRPSVGNSYAMEGGSNQHACYYRSGYDISVPLAPKTLFPELEKIPPGKRQYLLTFKGCLYLSGFGGEERAAAARIHDPASRVVSVVRCFDLHGEHLLPGNVEYCSRAHERYDSFDYGRLMNTTFGLVPSGRSPGTYRLGEVMSAGAIPVFVMRGAVLPLPEKIDWASFSFVFAPEDVGPGMIEVLRRAAESDRILEMQEQSVKAYWKLFGGTTNFSVVAENTLEQLSQRLAVSL